MFNIFEQPYTLIGAAVLILFGMLTFRSVFPEKRHWWQMLVPLFVAGLGVGLDVFVETDLEKINAVINKGIKAVQEEDCAAIGQIVTANYSDSFHDTKEQLLDHCRKILTPSLVVKHKRTGALIEITGPKATAVLFTILTFDKNSYIAQSYKSFLMTKSKLTLQKQPDSKWLISRVELLELDRQPVNWDHIR